MAKRSERRVDPVKSAEEIAGIRQAAAVVTGIHRALAELIVPGETTARLDKVAEEFIGDAGGVPAFKGYVMSDEEPFPSTLCTSINDVVVHGFPDERPIEEGDILSVDVGVELDGFFGDCARTYAVGPIDEQRAKLLEVTNASLYDGIAAIEPGGWVFDIARAVQKRAEAAGYGVVRDLVGHGIGRSLHEDPAVPNFVPNPFQRHRYANLRLQAGMVICIEPMVNAGGHRVVTKEDGWRIFSADGSDSAHFEHMVLVTESGVEILTDHLEAPSDFVPAG